MISSLKVIVKANPDIRNEFDRLPLDEAIQTGRNEIADLLGEYLPEVKIEQGIAGDEDTQDMDEEDPLDNRSYQSEECMREEEAKQGSKKISKEEI